MWTSHLTQLNEKALLKAIEIEGWPQALRRQSVFARFYCSCSLSLHLAVTWKDELKRATRWLKSPKRSCWPSLSLSSADEEEGLWQKLNDKGSLEFSLCNISAWQGSVKWQDVSPSLWKVGVMAWSRQLTCLRFLMLPDNRSPFPSSMLILLRFTWCWWENIFCLWEP